MKKTIFLSIAVIFALSVSSCGSTSAAQKSDTELAGYTLKNKKELMLQKVLYKKNKTVLVIP